MSRFLLLLLTAATLASCAEGARLFNDPPPADAQERAGAHSGTMSGAGGSVKGL